MQCVYCTASSMERVHANGVASTVLDEIEATVEAAVERGLDVVRFFFADDEFNLPDERLPLGILRGLRERGLERRVRWRAYLNPTPVSDELLELAATTGGHLSFTVDSAAEAVLRRSQKPFRRRHLDALAERLRWYSLPVDLGLIFGLPGETEATIAETVAFLRRLPGDVDVYYSAGARVYPNTPLAAIATAEPGRVVGDPSFFAPAVYSSPWPARELARRLRELLDDLPCVRHHSVVAYRSGRTTFADAYRAVLEGAGADEWARVLALAERPGDVQHDPQGNLLACLQIAVWHDRFDLAASACRRLLALELPESVSRPGLRRALLVYRALGLADRVSRRRRTATPLPEPAG